jgi:hypothetical protein
LQTWGELSRSLVEGSWTHGRTICCQLQSFDGGRRPSGSDGERELHLENMQRGGSAEFPTSIERGMRQGDRAHHARPDWLVRVPVAWVGLNSPWATFSDGWDPSDFGPGRLQHELPFKLIRE